jgi:hypothetical protein
MARFGHRPVRVHPGVYVQPGPRLQGSSQYMARAGTRATAERGAPCLYTCPRPAPRRAARLGAPSTAASGLPAPVTNGPYTGFYNVGHDPVGGPGDRAGSTCSTLGPVAIHCARPMTRAGSTGSDFGSGRDSPRRDPRRSSWCGRRATGWARRVDGERLRVRMRFATAQAELEPLQRRVGGPTQRVSLGLFGGHGRVGEAEWLQRCSIGGRGVELASGGGAATAAMQCRRPLASKASSLPL